MGSASVSKKVDQSSDYSHDARDRTDPRSYNLVKIIPAFDFSPHAFGLHRVGSPFLFFSK
jgi:hypothetical protein